MASVKDIARYVRSKNAGPFWVTIDIFCRDEDSYEKIKLSKNVTVPTIAALYHLDEKNIKVFYVDNIYAIKFSFPRPTPQGNKYENDLHFGQQYIRLVDIEV